MWRLFISRNIIYIMLRRRGRGQAEAPVSLPQLRHVLASNRAEAAARIQVSRAAI
jgi:hypothetical protein